MRTPWQRLGLVATIALAAGWMLGARPLMTNADKPLAHMVFFTLKDRSPESRAAFAADCQKYLSGHDGTLYFSVGTIAEDVVEPTVSVRDFDVSLHLVVKNKEARDNYLVNPRHTAFVEANRENFAQVRVFDTYLDTK